MIYVASSWRNRHFENIVDDLRSNGLDCYDFKRDEGAKFGWHEVGVNSGEETFEHYQLGMKHSRVKAGFKSDSDAMTKATTCLLLLPCGRSAHLELGWMCGQNKNTAIWFPPDENVTPELMYGFVDFMSNNFTDIRGWCMKVEGVDC